MFFFLCIKSIGLILAQFLFATSVLVGALRTLPGAPPPIWLIMYICLATDWGPNPSMRTSIWIVGPDPRLPNQFALQMQGQQRDRDATTLTKINHFQVRTAGDNTEKCFWDCRHPILSDRRSQLRLLSAFDNCSKFSSGFCARFKQLHSCTLTQQQLLSNV